MNRYLTLLVVLSALCTPAHAAPDHALMAETAMSQQILPATRDFRAATSRYEATVADCAPDRMPALTAGYWRLWDSWLALSIYRFGPVEADHRPLSIAFWPDKKGFTPRALAALLAAQDPVVDDPDAFARTSIAGRGLMALEWLLYEHRTLDPYTCRLIGAIAADLSRTAMLIDTEWTDHWAGIFVTAGSAGNPHLRSPTEATQRLFGALLGALEETIDLRLARPLGSLERSHPRRAEAWRSRRSLPNIAVVLAATHALYQSTLRPQLDWALRKEMDLTFATCQSALASAQEVAPLATAVETTDRIRIDALHAALTGLRDVVIDAVGPQLGVSEGFNSRDGD